LQWQPSDNLEIYVDWTHGEMDEAREQLRSWLRVEDALDRLDRGDTPTQITNITINTDDANDDSFGTVTAFDFLNFTEDRGRTQADIASLLLDTDETIDVGGLNVKWSNDDWTIAADFGYASQELEFLQRRMFANLDYSTFIDPARFPLEGSAPDDEAGVSGSFNLTSDGPIVEYIDPMGVPFDVTDATDLNFHRDRQTFRIEDNSETSFRLDFAKELLDRDDGDLVSFFDRFNFGVNFRERDGFRTEKRVDGSAGDRDDRGEFSDIAITQFGTQMVTGFMGDTSFIVPDLQAWIAADPAGTFAQDASQGTVHDIEYSIAEDITSAYLQGSFSGGDRYPYRGNIGVRYAETEQTSTGLLSVSDNEIVTTDRTYDDVLPSANIAFDLTDSVVFRLAASRTITRPDPFDLRQGWDLEEVDGTDNEGESGNPELEPYRTDNYDMSLEWYPDRGGSYAIGVFHKKLDGYIADGVEFVDIDLSVFDPVLGITEFEIDRPVNTDGGTITGVELALHTPFDTFTDGFMSNFGITASVTYVDAELDAIREDTDFFVELRGTSEWSGNIVGYYENGPFGARLAYNVRNDFLHQEAISSVKFDEFTKGTEYVTLNLDYRFNKNWRLRFTGENLTDSQRFRQFGTAGRRYFGDQRDDGRTYVLELRGNM